MKNKYKAKVFMSEYAIVDALKDGEVDIALLDLYQQPTNTHFCFVYLTRQTAEAISSELDLALPGRAIEIFSATIKLTMRGKKSGEVVELLKTELEIGVI